MRLNVSRSSCSGGGVVERSRGLQPWLMKALTGNHNNHNTSVCPIVAPIQGVTVRAIERSAVDSIAVTLRQLPAKGVQRHGHVPQLRKRATRPQAARTSKYPSSKCPHGSRGAGGQSSLEAGTQGCLSTCKHMAQTGGGGVAVGESPWRPVPTPKGNTTR